MALSCGNPMLRVSIEQWRAFAQTARLGSVRQAALRLNKTPSALSHSIRKIETAYGLPLFEAKGRSIALTYTGKMLLPLAEEVVALAEAAEQACTTSCIQCLSGKGVFPIAVDVHFPGPILAETMRRLRWRFPELTFRVYEVDRDTAEAHLQNDVARVAVVSGALTHATVEPLFDVELVCVVGRDHPLVEIDDGRPEDLEAFTELRVETGLVHGSSMADRRLCTVNHPATALAMLQATGAFAWLPAPTVAQAVETGAAVVLTWAAEAPVYRRLYVASAAEAETCDVALDFVAVVRSLAEPYDAGRAAPS